MTPHEKFTPFQFDSPVYSCDSGSEAAGELRTAGEAAEGSERRAKEDVFGSRSLHHHRSALSPQGGQIFHAWCHSLSIRCK